MSFASNLIINIYSFVILVVIYVYSTRQKEKLFLQQKLFIIMLQVTLIMLFFDTFSRFDGNPGTYYSQLNQIGNFVIFLLNPVIPSLWLLFSYYEVHHDENEIQVTRLIKPLIAIFSLNGAMTVLSLFFGWFYYIDEDNIYHRGPLFMIPVLITIGLIVAAQILIVLNRRRIEKKHYSSLVFFAVPPFVCIVLQLMLYGASLVLNGLSISFLIVFLTMQNRRMDTDFLTGVYNRKKLEAYLEHKISTSSEHKTFAAILIDLNNFKSINDTFGHDVGDQALVNAVAVLKGCLRSNDFIARYGGDEFYIILDLSNQKSLERTVRRIYSHLERYNENHSNPYSLGFSMGYAMYDQFSGMKAEDFQKQLDTLMYRNKREIQS